jgi:hypothetical protein
MIHKYKILNTILGTWVFLKHTKLHWAGLGVLEVVVEEEGDVGAGPAAGGVRSQECDFLSRESPGQAGRGGGDPEEGGGRGGGVGEAGGPGGGEPGRRAGEQRAPARAPGGGGPRRLRVRPGGEGP